MPSLKVTNENKKRECGLMMTKKLGEKIQDKLLLLALVMQAWYARVKFASILPVCYRNNVVYFKGSSFISIAQHSQRILPFVDSHWLYSGFPSV